MQPYLFAYLGYWQLIANTDKWIFFDVVQYNKRSWMNRNRILHPDASKEDQYISTPIRKHKNGTLIKDVYINNDINWKDDILGKLTVYKKLSAPYYQNVMEIINNVLSKDHDRFVDISITSTLCFCEYIGIDINYQMASEIDFDRSAITEPGHWALQITKTLGYDQYINPYGGHEIFDEEDYNNNGIDIKFLRPVLSQYDQGGRSEFLPGLSIIDVAMWHSQEALKNIIKTDFKLLSKSDLENE